jgi:hypothetical protein
MPLLSLLIGAGSALAAGVARFFGGPLVRGPLLVRSAATLAGDLSLPFRTHRRKAAPLFSFRCHHYDLLAHLAHTKGLTMPFDLPDTASKDVPALHGAAH